MHKSGIIRSILQLLSVFIIMVSLAACDDEKTADPISAPISSTTNFSTPEPTITAEPGQSPVANTSTENPAPTESPSKDNAIKASVQPSPQATAAALSPKVESESTAPAPPTAASAPPSSAPTAATEKGVSLRIVGDDKAGVILDSTIVEVEGEVSVITLLQKETRKEKIQMESSGKGIFAYVKGIANLYEFDRGAKSGWLFKVNGVFADKGAGSYKVKAGDQVEWLYTLDLGKDVGAKP